MKNKLMMLLNTLAEIETHGDGTLKMASCLQFVEQLANECDKPQTKSVPAVENGAKTKSVPA